MKLRLLAAVLCAALATNAIRPAHAADHADWTTPIAPFKISGNLYYVGSRDLAAYLVHTPQGNILINANLASSPALIKASVEKLGFQWAGTKILLSSQAHYDHIAGAAEIIKETHAKYEVMDGDVKVAEDGGASDFDPTLDHFQGAHVDHVLHDGEKITLGGTTIVAHKTAGHTRGCTTYTLDTQENGKTYHVVIVGGWAANPGVRFVPTGGKPASYPGIKADFEKTFVTLKALPCDIYVGAHGVYFDMLQKLARMPKEGDAVWIDPQGYQKAVAEHEASWRAELAKQQAAK
jgi:metallo-beta-lactamase class B